MQPTEYKAAQQRVALQQMREMRLNTCGCWWPSRAFPKAQPDWAAIYWELLGLSNDAINYRDDTEEHDRLYALADIAHRKAERLLGRAI